MEMGQIFQNMGHLDSRYMHILCTCSTVVCGGSYVVYRFKKHSLKLSELDFNRFHPICIYISLYIHIIQAYLLISLCFSS